MDQAFEIRISVTIYTALPMYPTAKRQEAEEQQDTSTSPGKQPQLAKSEFPFQLDKSNDLSLKPNTRTRSTNRPNTSCTGASHKTKPNNGESQAANAGPDQTLSNQPEGNRSVYRGSDVTRTHLPSRRPRSSIPPPNKTNAQAELTIVCGMRACGTAHGYQIAECHIGWWMPRFVGVLFSSFLIFR